MTTERTTALGGDFPQGNETKAPARDEGERTVARSKNEPPTNPPEIWLQPACCAASEIDGRRWSWDRWEECDCPDPQPDIRYVPAETPLTSQAIDYEAERSRLSHEFDPDAFTDRKVRREVERDNAIRRTLAYQYADRVLARRGVRS